MTLSAFYRWTRSAVSKCYPSIMVLMIQCFFAGIMDNLARLHAQRFAIQQQEIHILLAAVSVVNSMRFREYKEGFTMRSTRNKEYIKEVRQYITYCIEYDDSPTDSPADQFKTMVDVALIPWTRGNVRRGHFVGWRDFMNFERATLDFDYVIFQQEALIKQWLQVDTLSKYMSDDIEAKFYSMIFPVFNEMMKEYTGKTFEQTVKEVR